VAIKVFSVGGADTRDQGIEEMSFFALEAFMSDCVLNMVVCFG